MGRIAFGTSRPFHRRVHRILSLIRTVLDANTDASVAFVAAGVKAPAIWRVYMHGIIRIHSDEAYHYTLVLLV